MGRRSPATAVRRSSGCSSNSPTARASCSSAQSVSTLASSTRAPWSRTRGLRARRRSGSGSATARRCSATEKDREWRSMSRSTGRDTGATSLGRPGGRGAVMAVGMKEPAELARRVEENPQLPAAGCERVSGYGVMGLLFRSEHVLGLRRWTASSVGEGFTSIWHRNTARRWTFYESLRSEIACTRYFGAEVEQVRVGPIALDWQDRRRLPIYTADGAGGRTIEIGSNRRPLLTMRCSWQLRTHGSGFGLVPRLSA